MADTLDYETFKGVNAKLNELVLNTLSLLEGQKKLKSESVDAYLDEIKQRALEVAGNPLEESKVQEHIGKINQALSDALQQIQAQGGVDEQAMQQMETKLNAKIEELKNHIQNNLETKIEEIKQSDFQERAREAGEELKQKSAQITGAMLKTMTTSIERIKSITKQSIGSLTQSKELKRRLLPDAHYQHGLCFAEVEEGFSEESDEVETEAREGSDEREQRETEASAQTSDAIAPRFRPCGWTDFTQMEKNLHYKRLTFLGNGGNHWGFTYAQNSSQGLMKTFDISEHNITHLICGHLNYFGFTKDRTKMLVMGYNHSGMLGVGHNSAVGNPTMLNTFRSPIKKFQGCFYCTALLLEDNTLWTSGYTSGRNVFTMYQENVDDFILYYGGQKGNGHYGFFIRKTDGRLLSCLGNNFLTLNPVENGISWFPKLTSDYKTQIAGDKFVKMFGGYYDIVLQLKDNKAIICNTDQASNDAYLFSFDAPIKKKIRHLCLLENGKLHSLNANANTFTTLRSDVVDFTLHNGSEQRGQQGIIVLTKSGEVFIWGNPRVLSGNNQDNVSNYKAASGVIEIAGHTRTNNAYVLKKDNGIYTAFPTFNILDRVL